MSSDTATTNLSQIKVEVFKFWQRIMKSVSLLQERVKRSGGRLGLAIEDGVGLAFNASIVAIRRLTFDNFSRRLSSLIVKGMSSSILPTSSITISITSELTSSESGGDAST
nr:hypothetical protein [Tanacetum cinerariifolium]